VLVLETFGALDNHHIGTSRCDLSVFLAKITSKSLISPLMTVTSQSAVHPRGFSGARASRQVACCSSIPVPENGRTPNVRGTRAGAHQVMQPSLQCTASSVHFASDNQAFLSNPILFRNDRERLGVVMCNFSAPSCPLLTIMKVASSRG
jgi:hypothetical protein